MISLRKVWKIYKMGSATVNALRGVTLDVWQGEFVAIIGPSGSGKSTLMNLVGALDKPSRGHIFLDGKDISLMEESDLAQIRGQKIGFIFQQFNLLPALSATGNVGLPMIFQGIPEAKRVERATELLNSVNLGERLNHKPNELSGGQQQRVAIARALANEPEMLLADEPTGNLDSKTGGEIMSMLEDLHTKKGRTIVLVTHDIHLVKHAERVIYLKDGQIEKVVKNHKRGHKHA
ncbi:ATP-binding cassette domain-containing protein [Candidatus Woesearchaeota archaeon]|nr:ATP-binding cassette domain-containing protein [Candidatus Woesearchaeota archaeon]